MTYYPVSAVAEGQGLNITVQSYRDHLDFGLISVPRAGARPVGPRRPVPRGARRAGEAGPVGQNTTSFGGRHVLYRSLRIRPGIRDRSSTERRSRNAAGSVRPDPANGPGRVRNLERARCVGNHVFRSRVRQLLGHREHRHALDAGASFESVAQLLDYFGFPLVPSSSDDFVVAIDLITLGASVQPLTYQVDIDLQGVPQQIGTDHPNPGNRRRCWLRLPSVPSWHSGVLHAASSGSLPALHPRSRLRLRPGDGDAERGGLRRARRPGRHLHELLEGGRPAARPKFRSPRAHFCSPADPGVRTCTGRLVASTG